MSEEVIEQKGTIGTQVAQSEEKKDSPKDQRPQPEGTMTVEEILAKYEKPFVHLHVHSEYSLLDGAARITRGHDSPLLDACVAKGMPGCALTDHGNMFGAYTFYKAANKKNLRPICGCEFYVCNDMHKQDSKERFHLVLLAKTTKGYRNLVKIDSLAYTEGYYYKPRIDIELLKQHTEGVICLSGCLSGSVSQYLVHGDYESAKNYAIMLRDMFAPGDFYIELQDHGIAEERRINPLLVKIAKEIGVKVVATNDVHYIEQSDAEMHDTLLCIQTGKKASDENRMRFDTDQFYLKDYDEMIKLFSWCPEAVYNTIEVMEKCNITIKKEALMPPYHPEDGSTPEEYLRKLAYDGLKKRYGEITPEIRDRAEYELGIIIRMGFAEYYLIVWDFINYALSVGIPVGAGRGSGVSSIIAYAIHITNVDPLKYNLLFERFLNPERISAPDFDVDFCMDRRGEVIEYVTRKYGREKVCQILALGTMKAKGAIKDVARVFDVSLDKVNKATKAIPNTPGLTLNMVLGRVKVPDKITDPEERAEKEAELKQAQCPEVIDIYENDEEMRRVIDMALQLEGMPRNCSKHAAGVVICREVISDFVPLQKNGDDITTQFQKEEVEELGMLKMDFLGLTTLTDIAKAKNYIKENHGVDVDFAKLGYDDPEVYKLISTGETDAVFQLESAGMKSFMKELQPESLEDIIAGISLFRPGPIDSIPGFVEAKRNPAKIRYDHPLLEPILKMTYGFLVYQEQVMQVVQALAGYSLGRADILRRAMGKKKVEIMMAEKEVFINGCPAKPEVKNDMGVVVSKAEKAVDGCIKRGVPREVAEKVFDDMASFAKYAFNKSHAAAYAVLAYETAYLKRYYLVELVAAVINDRITKADEIAKYLLFLREKGKEVLPPDINKSDTIFRATKEGAIRFGLNGIKNVGEAAMKLLVEEREAHGEYKSINDLLNRLPAGTINKKCFECLIKAGAFDQFGHNRATLMANYESMLALANYKKKKENDGQISIFEELVEDDSEDDLKPVKEFEKLQLYSMEKEVLNIYMSGHPLEEYTKAIENQPFNLKRILPLLTPPDEDTGEEDENAPMSERDQLIQEYTDKEVQFGGMITNFAKKVTKKGTLMASAVVEDLYGAMEIVFFPRVYEKYKDILENDKIVKVKGKVNTSNEEHITLNVQAVTIWDKDHIQDIDFPEEKKKNEYSQDTRKMYIKVINRMQFLRIKNIVENSPGKDQVLIQYEGQLLSGLPNCNIRSSVVNQIKDIVGAEYVKIK